VKPLLTIGLPVHNDAGGAIFTLNTIRMYYEEILPRVEFLVVNDSGDIGHAGALQGYCQAAGVRYVQNADPRGPALNKDLVFREAAGEWVACIDCHIQFKPGSLTRLMGELTKRQGSLDMLTGPMLYDGHVIKQDIFSFRWRGNMFGTWGNVWRCPCGQTLDPRDEPDASGRLAFFRVVGTPAELTEELTACPGCGRRLPQVPFHSHEPHLAAAGLKRACDGREPTEIGASGCGVMIMRKRAWPRFNPKLKGFGGEEWYIHELVRRGGGKVWSLPWLVWWHKFQKENPQPETYLNSSWLRTRNYVIEWHQLGWPLDAVREHFAPPAPTPEGKLPPHEWDDLMTDPADPPEWSRAVRSGAVPPPPGYTAAPAAPVAPPEGLGGCQGCTNTVQQAILPDHITLDHLFTGAAWQPSDINEHAGTLRRLASEAETVVEFGVRHGVSTVALLSGQPKRFVTHDVNDFAMREALKNRQGRTDFTFRQANSLTCEPVECDLLFIDTFHHAEHLWQELNRHGPHCRRRIVLHDTVSYGWNSENGQQNMGLLHAVIKWCRDRPEWSVTAEYENNNGLLVMSRDPADKPEPPKVGVGAFLKFGAAMIRFKASGLPVLEDAEVAARLDVCAICKLRNNDQCTKCGCFLIERPDGGPGKALIPTEDCPYAKWPPPPHVRAAQAAAGKAPPPGRPSQGDAGPKAGAA
jgi:glycosyltransferase involved in cell wall biosynthesis